MATVESVTGPIDCRDLGVTFLHEHICSTSPGFWQAWPELFGGREVFIEQAAAALRELKATGGGTFVDVSTMDLGRDVRMLRDISVQSGMPIVACTGHWLDGSRSMQVRTVEEITEFFLHEIRDGLEGTGIKPGIIKVATADSATLSAFEEKILRAAARAHRESGLPITTHTGAKMEVGLRQAAVLEDEGVDPTRVHVGHSDETPYQKLFAQRLWNKSPVEHLNDLEFLGPELSCAHAVWLTRHDIDLFAQNGVGISHNPTSNLRLKSGQAPLHAMHTAGVYVALGMDEAGFNDDCDILTEMRLAAVLSNDPGVDEPHLTSAQLLHMATQNGARITTFGDRIGTLATGKRADVILIDLNRITTPYLDPSVDIVDALLYRARGVDVDTVIVDGQVLMRNRILTTIDKTDVLNQLADTLRQPRSEAEQEWVGLVQAITPHIQAFFADWQLETGQPFSIRNRTV